MNPVEPSPAFRVNARRITWSLVLGLFAWGLYLAIGAWRFNRDLRKGIIVMLFSLAFLGLWGIALALTKRRQAAEKPSNEQNWVCLMAFLFGLLSVGSMAAPLATIGQSMHRFSLLASLFSMLVAAVLAIVGLSDRARRTWQWLGLLSLILIVTAILVGFIVPPVTVHSQPRIHNVMVNRLSLEVTVHGNCPLALLRGGQVPFSAASSLGKLAITEPKKVPDPTPVNGYD